MSIKWFMKKTGGRWNLTRKNKSVFWSSTTYEKGVNYVDMFADDDDTYIEQFEDGASQEMTVEELRKQ